MKNISKLFVIYSCIFSFLFMHTMPAYAGVIGTVQLFDEYQVEHKKEQLLNAVAREDVRTLLEQNGVSTELAHARINAMTDAEVQMLADNFEGLPAAGSIGTAAALLILILVIMVLALGR